MKLRKCIAVILAFAVLTVLNSGCSLDFFTDKKDKHEESSSMFSSERSENPKLSQISNDDNYEVTDTSEKQEYSMKNTLNEAQTEIYNKFIYDIEAYETEFVFENVSDDDLKLAYYAVLDDHPEYFWLGKSFSYSVNSLGDYSNIKAIPDCMSKDPSEIKLLQKRMDKLVDEIVKNASAKNNPYEKILYIHDYIIDNTVYDSETLELINSEKNKGLLNASTAYGCLVEHRAICSGYSAAFQLLADKLEIDCYRVSGTRISEEGPHQWNFLRLDDGYYYMDLTWDDPIRENNDSEKTYEYFLISDDDLFKTHTLDNERPVPKCNGRKYNYYVYNGLYFEEYDFGYIEDAVNRDPEKGIVSVKFATGEQREAAVSDLMDNMNIFNMPYVRGRVSYTQSASGLILTIKYDV